MSFKRPIPRAHSTAPTQFVSSALPGGGVSSQWIHAAPQRVVPSGHPSRVGQILDKMRGGVHPSHPPETVWTPPSDSDFIAKHMEYPAQFIARCKEWREKRPIAAPRPPPPPLDLNFEPIFAVYKKYERREGGAKVPPLPELEKAWRLAGYSEQKIQKALSFYKKMEATSADRQKALDLIFIKFPSASKPTPKARAKKVIKVVKKKMANSSNE